MTTTNTAVNHLFNLNVLFKMIFLVSAVIKVLLMDDKKSILSVKNISTNYDWHYGYIIDYEKETVHQTELACNERKWGGTSAGTDENGQTDVWC